MATRKFKRDTKGRFATVDAGGRRKAEDRAIDRIEKNAAAEKKALAINEAMRELKAAQAENRRAKRDYAALKNSSAEGPVWDDFAETLQDSITRLSKANIKLQQIKKGSR